MHGISPRRELRGDCFNYQRYTRTHRYRKRYLIEIGVDNGTYGTYTTNGTNGLRQTHQHIGLICPICPIGLISRKANG